MVVDFLTSPLFVQFSAERPMAVMAQMTLSHLLDPVSLQRVFDEHAETQYERTLTFAVLAKMVSLVVLSKQPSINAAWRKMRDEVAVSVTATYGKLERVEPAVSQALVRYSFARAIAVREALGGRPRRLIAGYETRILDGNHLSGTERRLKETRDLTAAPLPGKSLVVMSPRHDAICDYFPIEDGHAQERSALDEVLGTVRRRQLWVADRNFCTLMFLYGIAAREAAFVIRQHGQLRGVACGAPRKAGKTPTGTVWEQTLQLPEHDGKSLTVRRIVVKLKSPTRDGDWEIALLTNLPEKQADAVEIAETYRLRWRIETAFQHLTTVLNCELNTLCYPKAALFCFATALVAYNALSILKGAIAAAHGDESASLLSHYYMALEVEKATDGMLVVLKPDQWDCFSSMPSDEFATILTKVAAGMDPAAYRKSVRGPKKPKPKKQHRKRSVHVSTHQILERR